MWQGQTRKEGGRGSCEEADPAYRELKRVVSLLPLIMDYLEQGPLFFVPLTSLEDADK